MLNNFLYKLSLKMKLNYFSTASSVDGAPPLPLRIIRTVESWLLSSFSSKHAPWQTVLHGGSTPSANSQFSPGSVNCDSVKFSHTSLQSFSGGTVHATARRRTYFLPARRTKRGPCYGNVCVRLSVCLSVTAGIVSKRLNLS